MEVADKALAAVYQLDPSDPDYQANQINWYSSKMLEATPGNLFLVTIAKNQLLEVKL